MRLFGLVLAIGGVALAFSQSHGSASPYALLGDFMCILAAMFWAGIPLVTRTTRLSNALPEMQLIYQLVVSAVVLTVAAPLFGDLIRDFTPAIAGIFLFQSFVVVAFSFSLWFWALSVYPASDMASFSFLTPVIAVFFGWVIFDDQITATFLVALALVGIGIVLVTRRPSPPAPLPEGEGSKGMPGPLQNGEGSKGMPGPLGEGEGSKVIRP